MKKYHYDGLSLKNGRHVNMDSLLLKERRIGGAAVLLAVICDGVGGVADGVFAASTTIHELSSWFDRQEERTDLGAELRRAVLDINALIAAEAETRGLHTASTLSALLLVEENYHLVHIGDSRIYLYREGELRLLTYDHVTADGRLNAWIGYKGEPPVLYQEGGVEEGTILLCSDGLYKRMDPDYLLEALDALRSKNLKPVMRQLADHVITQGERDNISLAFVKIT